MVQTKNKEIVYVSSFLFRAKAETSGILQNKSTWEITGTLVSIEIENKLLYL